MSTYNYAYGYLKLQVLYYLLTTLIAVIIGIVLVVTIQPGGYAEPGEPGERLADSNDFILDLVR